MFNPNRGALSTLLIDDGLGSKEQPNELFSKPSEITLYTKNQTESSGRGSPFFFRQSITKRTQWMVLHGSSSTLLAVITPNILKCTNHAHILPKSPIYRTSRHTKLKIPRILFLDKMSIINNQVSFRNVTWTVFLVPIHKITWHNPQSYDKSEGRLPSS